MVWEKNFTKFARASRETRQGAIFAKPTEDVPDLHLRTMLRACAPGLPLRKNMARFLKQQNMPLADQRTVLNYNN